MKRSWIITGLLAALIGAATLAPAAVEAKGGTRIVLKASKAYPGASGKARGQARQLLRGLDEGRLGEDQRLRRRPDQPAGVELPDSPRGNGHQGEDGPGRVGRLRKVLEVRRR